MQKKIRVGITQGDTNGIGYEVLIKALADSRINELCTPVIYGSPRLLGFYKKISSGVENFNVHITHTASDLHYKMVNLVPVSYTHLDVYKRQGTLCLFCGSR